MILGVIGISKTFDYVKHPNLSDYLSWMYVTYYFFYYVIGLLCRKYIEQFHKLINNKYLCTILFCLSFVPLSNNQGINYIPVTARVIAIYYIFYSYESLFAKSTRLTNIVSFLGQHTLEIYFIHYFFLFRCKELVPILSDRPLIEFLLLGSAAIIIMLFCCAIRRLIDVFKPISVILFGAKKLSN